MTRRAFYLEEFMDETKPGWGSLGEEVHETPLRELTPREIVERFLSQPDLGEVE
jgi:hypothetical protein